MRTRSSDLLEPRVIHVSRSAGSVSGIFSHFVQVVDDHDEEFQAE